MMVKPYLVLRDQREKLNKGWQFSASANCVGTENATLKTGDYTLLGYENILAMERKGSISEFAKNITEDRFERELIRMDNFPFSFILLEFTMDDILNFPDGSGIPYTAQKYLKVTNYYILRRFNEIQVQHNVKVILCGTHGKEVASSLFKLVIENTGKCI